MREFKAGPWVRSLGYFRQTLLPSQKQGQSAKQRKEIHGFEIGTGAQDTPLELSVKQLVAQLIPRKPPQSPSISRARGRILALQQASVWNPW